MNSNAFFISFVAFILLANSMKAEIIIYENNYENYEQGTDITSLNYLVENAVISVQQDVNAHDGTKYLKSDNTSNNLYFKREFTLEVGKTYEWQITTKITNGVKHRIRVVSLSGHEYALEERYNNTWLTTVIRFTVIDEHESLYLQIYRWAKEELSIDGFKLIDTEETEVSETTVPSIFANNMVLQRNSSVKIWGKDGAGVAVNLNSTWGGNANTIADENGNWSTHLSTPAAGGPFSVTIQGTSEITLNNVMIGEVWLTAGQSNMQWRMNQSQTVNGAVDDINDSNNTNIRYFGVGKDTSLDQLDDVSGRWKVSSPSACPSFSAVSYYFAEMLQDSIQIPIGIICAAYGSANIESFIDRETIENFDFVTIPNTLLETPQKTPTAVYNAMIHPIIKYKIKGALWYQGEANRGFPDEYAQLLPAMVESWRTKNDQPNFPFYLAQIAPFDTQENNFDFWQMQLNLSETMINSGLASSLDINECNNIHPLEKKKVGQRLALWALSNNYGFTNIIPSSPLCIGFEKENQSLKLHFENVGSGLNSESQSLTHFEIAGSNGIYYQADAILNEDNTIEISSVHVSQPMKARYLYGNCLTPTLFSADGLPALMFETDYSLEPLNIDEKNEKIFKLYPNPASNKLLIQSQKQFKQIEIYNLNGQIVMKTHGNEEINISALKPGLYIVKIDNYYSKFIKN
ncbi:hypothetical protein KH5_15570 [Urechidicola sp. KH5]